jgi:hypothetical protein
MTHVKGQKYPTKYKNKKQWGQNTTRKIKDWTIQAQLKYAGERKGKSVFVH